MDAPNWHGENELITEVNADFGEVTLLDGVKSLKSITRYSNELARSSVIALDSALRDKMVTDVAAKLDAALIAGSGNTDPVTGRNTTPLGLLSYTGTNAMLGVGVLSLDDLHDAIGIALGNNADPNRMRWLMRSEVFVALRKIKDTSGKYLIEPDVTQAGGYRLLGLPVAISNRVPHNMGTNADETAVVLWDPGVVAVARDLAPSVKILTERYADYDQQAIRVVARFDAAPLLPESIVVLRGVTG